MMAPRRIWCGDQNTIARLSDRLAPKLIILFDAQCDHRISFGRSSVTKSGMRFSDIKGQSRIIRLKIYNASDITIDNREVYLTRLRIVAADGSTIREAVRDPIALRWSYLGDQNVKTISIHGHMTQPIDVVTQTGFDGIPIIAGAPLLWHYERAMSDPGIYMITVQAYGADSPASGAEIEMKWTLSDRRVHIEHAKLALATPS